MTATHYVEVPVEVTGHEVTLTLRVHGTYEPGCKAFTPTGEYAPTQPPEPPMFEISHVQEADGRLLPDWLLNNIDWEEIQAEIIQEYR